MHLKWVTALLSVVLSQFLFAHSLEIKVQDKASLRRGAKLFLNYCSGCHSLTYFQGLGLTDAHLLKRSALPPEDAKQWFGRVPPDLSLSAREKGINWLYTYLNSFYKDDSRPFGTNNQLVPDVTMPNILETMDKDLSKNEHDANIRDLLTFLSYVGAPEQELSHKLGFFVLGFLVILLLAAWSLKVVYWRNISG
jgi:ubiquinol-cytochrome c reductase cytochrome c1 subunit